MSKYFLKFLFFSAGLLSACAQNNLSFELGKPANDNSKSKFEIWKDAVDTGSLKENEIYFLSNGKQKLVSSLVFDMEDLLTAKQERSFDSLFRAHEQITGNEIVLVTSSDYGGFHKMSAYGNAFIHSKGVGKKDRDNGLGIFFSKNKKAIHIVSGLGTQKVLSDSIAKMMINQVMAPEFENKKVFDGLWQGSKLLIHFLERDENRIPENVKSNSY